MKRGSEGRPSYWVGCCCGGRGGGEGGAGDAGWASVHGFFVVWVVLVLVCVLVGIISRGKTKGGSFLGVDHHPILVLMESARVCFAEEIERENKSFQSQVMRRSEKKGGEEGGCRLGAKDGWWTGCLL